MDLVSDMPHRRCSPDTGYAIPPLGEIIPTRKEVERLEERLQSVSDEINGLQNRLVSLSHQKEALNKEIDVKMSMFSPVHRLLPELLQEIFYQCLSITHNPVMSNREAPVLLGQVCSRWRSITLATPELWAAIHISIPDVGHFYAHSGPTRVEAARLQGITLWLSRSGVLPLSISVAESAPIAQQHIPRISSYFKTLLSFSSRWKSIDFAIYGFHWVRDFLAKYQISDFPILEDIHIGGSRFHHADSGHRDALFVENSLLRSPTFRRVSLPLLGDLILETPIQWSQLTGLDLSGLGDSPLSRVIRTLSLCLNLTTLNMYFDPPPVSSDLALEQSITFPVLRALGIADYSSSSDSTRFLNHISAPEIRHISYGRYSSSLTSWTFQNVYHDQFSKFISAFALFTSKATHPIEEFSLGYDWLSEAEISQFLSHLQTVKRLSLNGSGRLPNSDWGRPSNMFLLEDRPFGRLFTVPRKRGNVVARNMKDDLDTSDDEDAASAITFGHDSTESDGGVAEEQEEEGVNPVLCPALEVFHCTGAMFSAATLLGFLRSRSVSCKVLGVSRIRNVYISFPSGVYGGHTEYIDGEIKALQQESGVVVHIHCNQPLVEDSRPPTPVVYSPHDGLAASGFMPPEDLYFKAGFDDFFQSY